jgi:signal transduction histidine kinase
VAVTIDYEKMAQVLTNLIDNAVKFVPEQNGRIEVLVEDRVETVRVHIRDNGPGIPENEKERIFDRYAQVEGNLKPGKYGTGLGLAICKELVNLHGGRIWVENSPSGGADFVFSLPKAQEGKTADLPAIAAGV